jgi:hypothetical protein
MIAYLYLLQPLAVHRWSSTSYQTGNIRYKQEAKGKSQVAEGNAKDKIKGVVDRL